MKLKIDDYDKIIKKILENHNVDFDIVITDSDNPMNYVPSRFELKVNPMAINRYLNKNIHPNIAEEEVIEIMVCHELGHHKELMFNPFINPIRVKEEGTEEDWDKFVIEREYGAWEYGKQFVPEHLMSEYNKLNENNLQVYKKQLGFK
jgi:hypothetical protein